MSELAFEAIAREAAARGTTPSVVAASTLEQRFAGGNNGRTEVTDAEMEEARLRFERHFGEVSVPNALGLDNEQIDADLAREYADNHEAS